MLTFKKMAVFGLYYCLISLPTFPLLFFFWPGFPFFPTKVFKTKSEDRGTVRLEKGHYQILYFIEGERKLPVQRGDVGRVEIAVVVPGGDPKPVLVNSSNYYFDEAPDRVGIRGHAVGNFTIPIAEEIAVAGNFKKYGYDGLIIETGFMQMVIAIAVYEAAVALLSTALTMLAFKFLKHRKAKLLA